MEKQILVNCIKTPDGTLLFSHNRHDYKTYIDKNGLEYMVDGGNDYLRRNIYEKYPYIEMSLYIGEPHEKLRNFIHRGGRGKDGKEPLKYILIKDMSDEWIKNVIQYEEELRPNNIYLDIFRDEQIYRINNNIFIEDY